jgi:hypothetical protein
MHAVLQQIALRINQKMALAALDLLAAVVSTGSVGISVYGPGSSSQPETAFEENGELGFRHAPLPWRHLPLFLCLPQDQKQQLERALVGGKVAAGPHRPAQFGIQRLDGVGLPTVRQAPDKD